MSAAAAAAEMPFPWNLLTRRERESQNVKVQGTRVRSVVHCRDVSDFSTYCFTFSCLFLSTKQGARRRPQTGWYDSLAWKYISAWAPDLTLVPRTFTIWLECSVQWGGSQSPRSLQGNFSLIRRETIRVLLFRLRISYRYKMKPVVPRRRDSRNLAFTSFIMSVHFCTQFKSIVSSSNQSDKHIAIAS